MISIISLTLYDYLLAFDDEVRRQSPGPSAPALHALLRDSVCLEGPQVVGFVPLFTQTVKGELICELRNSFMPLYRGGSPRINRIGELFRTLALLRDQQNRILLIGYQFYVIYDISTPRKPEVSLKARHLYLPRFEPFLTGSIQNL